MGAHPYWYIVPCEDPQKALDKLRAREFKAGRYNPVTRMPRFPITDESPAPGPKHKTIAAAIEAADADGTRSILDIERISTTPEFCCAFPMTDEELNENFSSTKPTRDAIEKNLAVRFARNLLSGIKRGHCKYIVLYDNNKPSEILFAGHSCD